MTQERQSRGGGQNEMPKGECKVSYGIKKKKITCATCHRLLISFLKRGGEAEKNMEGKMEKGREREVER